MTLVKTYIMMSITIFGICSYFLYEWKSCKDKGNSRVVKDLIDECNN